MSGLSDDERQALKLYDSGMSHRDIMAEMSLASRHVARHMIDRAKKKVSLDSMNPGISTAMGELGVDLSNLRGGWLKNKTASLRFDVPRDQMKEQETIVEIMIEAFQDRLEKVPPTQAPWGTSKDLLTKYVLADLHMGMFSYAEETGEDYDLKIAEDLLTSSISQLLESTPNSETAMILNLGDVFHANDHKGMTPYSGNILDMDTRFAKIAVATVRAIRYCIETALQKHGKVIFGSIPGNHDVDQSHWLAIALMCAYENEPRVEILWSPSHWLKYRHGRNLIVAHHGDRVNFNRLVLAMAEKFSEEWGQTYWRFLDTGHVHHEREQEIGGALCRSYRTLAAKDAHADQSAYTSKRSLTAQTLHKEYGEIIVNNVNLYKGNLPK